MRWLVKGKRKTIEGLSATRLLTMLLTNETAERLANAAQPPLLPFR
jgi:hypothetical protein